MRDLPIFVLVFRGLFAIHFSAESLLCMQKVRNFLNRFFFSQVHLNGNHLYTIPLKLFDSNPALNLLSLDANYLADVPEDMFRVNKNLEAVGLQHNCISNVPQVRSNND